MAKKVYTNPKAGQPLISTISTDCITPILQVKFCNVINPFYFPNSPMIPRYSITCLLDPNKHQEFIKGIKNIESNEKVESVLKNETKKNKDEYIYTGNIVIKFQGKEKIPVYVGADEENLQEVEMQDELAPGERISVVYDIVRYTKKGTGAPEHGINFKPKYICYYPDLET